MLLASIYLVLTICFSICVLGLAFRELANVTLGYVKAVFVVDDSVCLEYVIIFSLFPETTLLRKCSVKKKECK